MAVTDEVTEATGGGDCMVLGGVWLDVCSIGGGAWLSGDLGAVFSASRLMMGMTRGLALLDVCFSLDSSGISTEEGNEQVMGE